MTSNFVSEEQALTVITQLLEEKSVTLGQDTYKVTLFCDDVIDLTGSERCLAETHIMKLPEVIPPKLRTIVRKTETFGNWVRCRTTAVALQNLTDGTMPTTSVLWEITLTSTSEFSLRASQILLDFRHDLEEDLQIYPTVLETIGFGENPEQENPPTPEDSVTASFTANQ